MITPTMLNDPAPGKKEPQMVVCWSDPKARSAANSRCFPVEFRATNSAKTARSSRFISIRLARRCEVWRRTFRLRPTKCESSPPKG